MSSGRRSRLEREELKHEREREREELKHEIEMEKLRREKAALDIE